MVVVTARAQLSPGTLDQARGLAIRCQELTQPEQGCISYRFYGALDDPNSLICVEEWESEADLHTHLQAEHTQTFLSSLGPLLSGAPSIVVHTVSESKVVG